MKCVKCEGQLIPVTVDGVEVDKCNVCSGVWFDLGELKSILKGKDNTPLRNVIQNNEGHDEIEASCPRCGGQTKMVRVVDPKDSSFHVDTCSICHGNWLDGGELEILQKKQVTLRQRIKNMIFDGYRD